MRKSPFLCLRRIASIIPVLREPAMTYHLCDLFGLAGRSNAHRTHRKSSRARKVALPATGGNMRLSVRLRGGAGRATPYRTAPLRDRRMEERIGGPRSPLWECIGDPERARATRGRRGHETSARGHSSRRPLSAPLGRGFAPGAPLLPGVPPARTRDGRRDGG